MTCKPDYEFHVDEMPNLSGYIAIVTGGNSGIGYETTLQLARRGARVYIASRSQQRVEQAILSMRNDSGPLDIQFLKMDLQDLQSIKSTVSEFTRRESHLDILINNAGIMSSPYELTKDGHEKQWQVNFLAHHALTLGLMPPIDAAFLMGPKAINYEDPNLTELKGLSPPSKRYGQSKQASIIAAKAITDHYRHSGITAYSLHPGIIKSNLQSHDTSVIGTLSRTAMKVFPTSTPADGARTTLFCATSPKAPADAGSFFIPYGKVDKKAGRWIDDAETVEKLWTLGKK